MPDFTLSDVHVNQALTSISIAYKQKAEEFIADRVFPIVEVAKASDKYFRFNKNDWLREEAGIRAPGTESPGSGFSIDSTSTYSCDIHAFHKDIPDAVLANSDLTDLETQITEYVTHALLLEREKDWVNNFFTTGVWQTDLTGVAAGVTGDFVYWDDYANSDPIADIRNQKLAVKKNTGFSPNILVVGEEVFEVLKHHPDILERYKYTQEGVLTADLIARVLGVEKLFVGGAVKATNVEGGTEAYDFVFGKNALLVYAPPRPGLLVPSGGYIFAWTGFNAGYAVKIKQFRMEHLEATRIEGEMAYDAKVVCGDLGVFFSGAIS